MTLEKFGWADMANFTIGLYQKVVEVYKPEWIDRLYVISDNITKQLD